MEAIGIIITNGSRNPSICALYMQVIIMADEDRNISLMLLRAWLAILPTKQFSAIKSATSNYWSKMMPQKPPKQPQPQRH